MRKIWKWLLPVILCGVLFTIKGDAYAAEPDEWGRIRTQQLPVEETDPGLSESWHLDRIGIRSIWDKLEASGRLPGEGTVIAVIDTGLASSTTCLNEARWCNEPELNGEAGVDDDGNGYVDDIYGLNLANRYAYQTDSVGHGTEVAGLIGMQPGDGGGAGLAYGAKIMPIKVSQDTNYDTDTVIEALQYAVNMGADVINMSFATYDPSDLLEEAVREAAKSCVLVAAAGNEGFVTEGELSRQEISDMGYTCKDAYPAAWDCCIGVMAGSVGTGLSEFTNWDQAQGQERKYDIVAPGEMLYTVTKGNRYTTVKGTSYATALVSATVAVYRGCLDEEVEAPELTRRFLAAMTQQTELYCAGHEFFFPVLTVDGFFPGETEEKPEAGTGASPEHSTEAETGASPEHSTEAETGASPEHNTGTEIKTTTEWNSKTETDSTADRKTEAAASVTTERKTEAAVASTTEQKCDALPRFGKVSMGRQKLVIVLKHKPVKGRMKVTISQVQKKKNGKKRQRVCRLSVKNGKAVVSWKKLRTKKFRSGKAVLRLVWKKGSCQITKTRQVRVKL